MNLNCLAPRTRRRVALIATVFLAALPFSVAAQETGDAAAGRKLAGLWCSSCHIVAPSAQAAGSNGVPTFAAIARRPSTTQTSLLSFLLKPHPVVQNMHASREELGDLIAYILSLRGR